ncbi:uncharacterized protein LOC130012935 isoform X2 [Patella vulgata]|uniref:uncharacterized protein LOC130012931 isoform X3 n=1 Tax=Patella vulgata TaxID=6465 RepID=UPI0024A8DFCB|nr:uncharacterized protein LOC130012931 isoform X3 [Patella vulgata]XP_055957104.1 uncharacterized protein LOC130012935 isoform X2 [Patella vulgata]
MDMKLTVLVVLATLCGVGLGSFNVALNKPTWQSSTYRSGVSSRVVDGNTYQWWSGGSCTSTNNKKAREWLCVDLKQSFDISSMKIFNRIDGGTNNIKGFEVRLSSTGNCDEGGFISATACYKDHTSTGQSIYTIDRCNQPSVPSLSARFVFVSIKRQYLYICELQIFTECDNTHWGDNCQRTCQCVAGHFLSCNQSVGTCNCNNQWTGDSCQDCARGYYGSNCDKVCHCYQSQCDQDTGVCEYGCEHGWMGIRCDQVKAAAEVATYCVNSPTEGKYALLRVNRKNVKYDKINIINESQDTSSSTTCDQRMFNEDADDVLNLKILIEDDNKTSPSCYHTKTDREVFKWTLRTEEVSGFYGYYDRLYELSCDFKTAETLTRNNKQTLSGIYQPSKVNVIQTTEDVQLFIQNPATSSRVSQVQIGSRIQLAMLLIKRDDITASGISPYNCSCSTPDGKTVHQLTDSSGCPVRDSPVFALTGSNGSFITSNIFDAFTIKGSLGLIFSCSFEFCFDSKETKCADRCSDLRTRSILGTRARTKRSTNENRKNGQASAYLLLIPKTQDKQTDTNNISVDSEGTISKHFTVITGSILVLVLCGGLVAAVLLVRSSRIRNVMKQTNVKITE